MSVPGVGGDMSVAKSLADVLARVATASTRAGRAAPVRARGAVAAGTRYCCSASRAALQRGMLRS